jgi:hypothetical protein
LAVLGVVLGDGELVEQVVVGKYHGLDGAAALVADAVVLVNGREWEPEVRRLPTAGLTVQGLQDGRHASLAFTSTEGQDSIEGIGDTQLAVELANRVRQRNPGG